MKIDPKKYYFCYGGQKINWKEDIDINDSTINYALTPQDCDIKFIDKIRAKEFGYTDSASSTDNEVYYNFYLEINLMTNERIVKVIVNNSEKDDFAEYEFECNMHYETFEEILRKTLLKIMKEEEYNMKIYVVVTEEHINGVKTLNTNVFLTEKEANEHLAFEKLQAETSFPDWKQIKVEGGFVIAKDINNNGDNFIECRIYEREVK